MNSNKVTNSLPHFDFFRGIAIILVFFYHCQFAIDINFPNVKYENYLLDTKEYFKLLLKINPFGFGYTGVHLFLIISGFLIHYGYLKNQATFKWTNFYKRRFWRIYPPYLIVLLFYTFYSPWIKINMNDFFSHLFLFHNYQDGTFFSINGAFWSLALEIQLYLIYPLLLVLRKKIGIEKCIVVGIMLNIFIKTMIFYYPNAETPKFQLSILSYWFLWILGAFAAERHLNKKPILNANVYKLIFMVILYYILLLFGTKIISLIDSIYLGFFWIFFVDFLLNNKFGNKIQHNMIYKFISFVGICSYGIYLLHGPYLNNIILWFAQIGPSVPFPLTYILASLIVFMIFLSISYFFYEFIEKKSIEYGKDKSIFKRNIF